MKGKNFISGIVMVATLCCWPSIASPQSFSLILEKLNRLEERLNNLEANQQGDIKRLQNQLSEIQTGQEVTSLVKAINWLRGQVDGVVAARLDQKARTNPNRATEIVNGLPMDTSEATDLLYELMVKYPIPEQEPPIESKTIPELKESEITGLGDILNATINDRLNGITFEAVYTSEISSNMFGGLRRATEYLDNVDLTLTVDAERLFGWKGASFFVYGLGNSGGNPSENVGDAQIVSNIEGPDTWKFYEIWIQQNLFLGKLSVLAGLYNLNSEFDVIETGQLFLNSSHGIGPDFSQTGLNGRSSRYEFRRRRRSSPVG